MSDLEREVFWPETSKPSCCSWTAARFVRNAPAPAGCEPEESPADAEALAVDVYSTILRAGYPIES